MKCGDIVIRRGLEGNPTAPRGRIVGFRGEWAPTLCRFANVVWGPDANGDARPEDPAGLVVLPPPQDAASQLAVSTPPAPEPIKAGDRVTFTAWRTNRPGTVRRDWPRSYQGAGLVLAREGDELFIRADDVVGYSQALKTERRHTARHVSDVEREPVAPKKPEVYHDALVELTPEVRAALTEKGLL